MATLSSSCRATLPSAQLRVGHRSNVRGSRNCLSQSRCALRLVRLAACAVVAVALVSTEWQYVRGVRAAAEAAGTGGADANSDLSSAAHVFDSLEELNGYVYGQPFMFEPVTWESQVEGDESPAGAISSSSSSSTEAQTAEASPATSRIPLSELTAALQAYTSLSSGAAPSRQHRNATPTAGAVGAQDSGAAVNVSDTSMCSADFTCPRSSVAWASGSFTSTGLLTPHSLALPVRLQLRLSLCCRYKFDGTLLRSREVYDGFLHELLQASPFQVLTPAEKRELFPQAAAYIVDTWHRRRVYNASYTLTEADVAMHNDGDGDVLILTTGVLRAASLHKVLSSSPALAAAHPTPDLSAGAAPAAGGSGVFDKWDGAVAGSDMQLRITNRVLKCKCPHILTVMPLLHVRRDALPPITIAGLGAHCGVEPTQKGAAAAGRYRSSAAATHRPRIRQVRRADGAVAFATSFQLEQQLPPTTLVSWTVSRVEDAAGGMSRSGGASAGVAGDQQAQENGGQLTSTPTGASPPPPSVRLLLRHTQFLPVVTNASGAAQYSSAASPFFIAEPNVRYEIAVTVMRGPLLNDTQLSVLSANDFTGTWTSSISGDGSDGSSSSQRDSQRDSYGGSAQGRPHDPAAAPSFAASLQLPQLWRDLRVQRSARGRFVLRVPLNRSWELPPVKPSPHFGFHRVLRLHNNTIEQHEVRAALDPHYNPASPLPSSGVVDEAEAGSGGGWFGLGRWASGRSGAAPVTANRTLAYYGYWEKAPLKDQPMPQVALRVPANPFLNASAASGVTVPLSIGRNLLAYVVRDVDDVCEPVVLEGREVWAVQSLIQTPGPVTSCGEETQVSALVLRELYFRMRAEAKIEVTVPNTSWTVDRAKPIEVAAEGTYDCAAVRDAGAASAAQALCAAVPDTARDGSGTFATLRMVRAGVFDVVWVVRVAVRGAALVEAENLDPLYARVLPGLTNTTFVVELRSPSLLVVRRLATYPAEVSVELPMHARRWLVDAPRAAAGGGGGGRSDRKSVDVLTGDVAAGYWRTHPPLRVLSVNERLTAELDTSQVPNVQRTLPNGTLEFVAQDRGEKMSLTTTLHGVRRTVAYTSRCPDTVVAYVLHVVAFPPPPLVPAFAPIYTEEECVVLVPPRAVRKDEVAEWQLPPCPGAASFESDRKPLYLIERTIPVEEQEEHAYVTTAADGGAPLATHAVPTAAATPAVTGNASVTVTQRRPVTALLVCGVAVYDRCEVVWSVRNLVAETHKTFSLRRCQRPPDVLFHEDAQQLPESYPASGLFALPSVPETVYVPVIAPLAAGAGEGEHTRKESQRQSGAGTAPSATAAVAAPALMSRQRHHRAIIPIAGYHTSLGYSFNYTGLQRHFEMHLRPLPDSVAHQLTVTQHDYVESEDDGGLVFRRRSSWEVQRSSASSSSSAAAAGGAEASTSWTATDASDGTDRGTWSGETEGESSATFWEDYATRQGTESTDATPPHVRHAQGMAAQRRKQQQEQQQRDRSRQLDQRLEEAYRILHEPAARRLRVADVGNSSLYPMDYVVRGAAAAGLSAEAAEDQLEFARRGMCVERPGHLAVLAVNPRGSVRTDERYGTVLPPPPAPAVAVLPFCAPRYTFARYPELASIYGYDYTWTCPDTAVMTVAKYHPMYSVISHTPETVRGGAAPPPRAAGDAAVNGTLCELRVENHITRTEQREWFLVQRVFPSPLSALLVVVLSDNAATSLQVLPATNARTRPHAAAPSSSSSSPSSQRRPSGAGRSSAAGEGSSAAAATAVVTMEELYAAPRGTFPFTRARRVVGKSVVLHVDAPSDPSVVQWAVTSIVPAATATVGTQVMMEEVGFELLPRHPAAVARGRGGSTVLITGLRTPGLYTLTHTVPDPANPEVCPPTTLTEMLDVFHARVLERELFVCGDTAALQAVPIPREIAHEFVGQWEVVSLATDAKTVWTAGANFTGIRFERGTRASTLVHGLPFGVVTMRWAIYRLLPPSSSSSAAYNSGTSAAASAASQRELVDFDTVEVYVLTENLPSHRLVTLSNQATLLTTSSTQNWKLVDVHSALHDANGNVGAAAAVAAGGESARLAGVRMSHSTVSNYSDGAATLLAEAVGEDAVGQALFHTYYGLQPRPGTGALTLRSLPVGTVYLEYDLVPSRSLFGKMVGHTCALRGHYEVERVSAYLAASTTLDHECDGYSGQGLITLCLVTDAASATSSAGGRATARNAAASSSAGRTHKKAPSSTRGRSAPASAHFWQSQVRLIDPASLEETMKRGAREYEDRSGGRCATPWWVAPTARWSAPAYTAVSAEQWRELSRRDGAAAAAASSSPSSPTLPGRCVSFRVRAGRHLSPREVAQPLFVAMPRLSSSAAPQGVDGAEGRRRRSGGGSRRSESAFSGGARGDGSGLCPYHGDFITTRIIDGAPLMEGGTVLRATAAASRGGSAAATAASAGSSFFGLSQLFQIGLPHSNTRSRETGNDEEEGDGGGAWGIHFLPVLQPHSLRRANATMRPIVGLRGVIDDVTSETNISGLGRAHYSAMEGSSSSSSSDDDDTRLRVEMEKDGSAATVLLRLDLTNAKHLGGYVLDASGSPASSSSSSTRFNASESPTIEPTYPTLLHKCVTGTLRGADVLQYWSETNRPDGRVDRTAQEWLDYTLAVRDATVRCDVLFPTLDHLITELYDPAGGSSSSGGGGGHAEKPAPRTGWLYGQQQQQQQQQQQRLPSSTPPSQPWTGSPALPSSQPAHRQPQYVSLAEMEQQVDRIRRQYRWTADGIDVTGLPPHLQNALSHRRITTTQLKAIEAARKARQAAEEAEAAQKQQQLTQRGLQNAPSQLSPTDRLLSALKAYRGVAEGGGEVAVLRIRLPLYEGFAVPYDVYLRTALHKDVVCGSAVDPPPALTDPPAQPTVANPHSLVPLGRLQIRDAPPALSLYPPVVKQCEVEGGLPVLTFELTGATFEGGVYTADDVQLEELANPAVVSAGETSGGVAPSDIGLAACVAEMRAGLKAVVESGSHRRLYLQLNACPHFKMLTPEEYNERQDSAELLRRLQHSRYLRVTVRRAIKPDSFLSAHGSPAGTGASSSSSSAARAQGSAAAVTTTRGGGADAQLLNTTTVIPTSTDATFVVEVRPTLARLHLRSSAHMAAPPPLPASSSSPSQAQRRRAPEDVETPANAGDEDSSWWSRVIGSTASRRDTSTSTISSAYAFPPTPTRPLLVCESDLHRYGMQLGIELIGDVWTDPVGEDSPALSSSGSRVTGSSGGSSALLPRQRAPPNVALLNSFSVVEHHSLDSSHHLYMKGGGVYRSHFINYLFSTLLSDPALLQRHTFVHRYNDTFVSLVLPPLSALPPSSAAARGGQRYGGQSASPHHHQPPHQRYSYAQADRATRGVALPSVRQFCKIEEILFAVPGIATECRGCLLADTTFFVAGDLTGVWTATSSSSSSSSAASVAGPGGSSAAATPSDRTRWTSDTFTSPLVLLWDRVGSVPRQWVLEWACPLTAHRALQAMAQQLSSRSDGAGVEVVMDVVLYKLRGLHGEELPAEQRPSVLMSTQPLSLSDVMARNAARVTGDGSAGRGDTVVAAPLELHVNQSGVEAAFTQLHDDVLRHRRRAWTMLDYHRDERYAGGALVVNASVFLKLCATDGVAGAGCTVVSITDALLAVEVPKVSHTSASRSWLRRVLWRSSPNTAASATHGSTASRYTAAPTSVAVLLHHGFMTYLWYDMLPLLGVVTLAAEGGAAVSESYRQDQQRAHIAFAVMGFIFLFFGYAFVPIVWTGLCLVLWSVSIYLNHRPELILLFVASVLYTHYLL